MNTPVYIKSEPISLNDIVVKSEPINCTPFIVQKRETNCSPLIVKEETDTLSSSGNKSENESIQALKRQQRMIKNRESACLSRKKKKEYVNSLEKQLSELKEENENLKLENNFLKQKLINIENGTASNKRKVGILNRNRKGIALFAIICMISVNINFLGILSWKLNLKMLFNKAPIPTSEIDEIKHSRTLLWAVDENNNDIGDDVEESFNKNMPVYQPICPNINQSESIRLDSELRRWIDGEADRDNWTSSTKPKFLLSSSLPLEGKPRKKLYLSQDRKIKAMHKVIDVPTAASNAVQVFSPILGEHASLFEALGRKDDTFYVVWFTGKHLLLPASRTNDTVRPKMSLILPAVSIKGTFSTPPDHITMMQIDCEVTNTQLLHLQQSIIPVHLRDNKSTSQSNQTHSVEDIVNSSTANIRNIRNHKPYFIKEANKKALYRKNFEDNIKIKYEDKNVRDFRNKNTIYVYKENF
ncbi:Cyclic AMP-dependent transcription factor ATF-6 alpha [Harpegnathos saltator]|uniref:Cyclic AMP-dependent transcription factor ATF-6 alpha n=2 Tax=Harpegnathos saltator TaxID=610380 RepID=E2BGG5_HARSA|nr:Cyclic AMP-dependent transcription factor ATF-6 alpha [Harpegnathos saltator]